MKKLIDSIDLETEFRNKNLTNYLEMYEAAHAKAKALNLPATGRNLLLSRSRVVFLNMRQKMKNETRVELF